jgi:hypothetical protein
MIDSNINSILDFILTLDNGFDTDLGIKGSGMSGGQRQVSDLGSENIVSQLRNCDLGYSVFASLVRSYGSPASCS